MQTFESFKQGKVFMQSSVPGILRTLIFSSLFFTPFGSHAEGYTMDEVYQSAVEKGKSIVNYWMNESGASVHSTHYADGCSYYGTCIFGDALDSSYYESILDRYTHTLPHRIPTGNVDSNAIGILPLHLYLHSKNDALLNLGIAAADDAIGHGGYKRNAIDDTYMFGSLMVQAYRVTDSAKYLDSCVEYVLYYMENLQQDNGLYNHRDGGPHRWGRGNGWGAASTTELMRVLPEDHPGYAGVLEGYRKQMTGLIGVQKNNGMWMQLLDSDNSANWEETSCMGMFLFAIFSGLHHGWLDAETFLEPAKKGWMAITSHINNGKLQNIAQGMWGGPNESDYLNVNHDHAGDAHGTAGVLWAATAIIRYHHMLVSADRELPHIGLSSVCIPRSAPELKVFDLNGRVRGAAIPRIPLSLPAGMYIHGNRNSASSSTILMP